MIINIEKYPQYELYLFTKKLYEIKENVVPDYCDNRCVYSTIINRCYYSSYLYVSLWLYERHGFEPLYKEDFVDKKFRTEHSQVRFKLKEINLDSISNKLYGLSNLRKKADYNPFSDISNEELKEAMFLMEQIFQSLKF